MKLQNLVPKSTSFKLRLLNDRLTMKPITLGDEIWLNESIGQEGIKVAFETVNFNQISRIVYRLLDNESKAKLKKQKVTFYNDEGEENTVELGGVKLLQSLISGWSEKEEILEALLKNLGFSDGMVGDISDNKKKVQ